MLFLRWAGGKQKTLRRVARRSHSSDIIRRQCQAEAMLLTLSGFQEPSYSPYVVWTPYPCSAWESSIFSAGIFPLPRPGLHTYSKPARTGHHSRHTRPPAYEAVRAHTHSFSQEQDGRTTCLRRGACPQATSRLETSFFKGWHASPVSTGAPHFNGKARPT